MLHHPPFIPTLTAILAFLITARIPGAGITPPGMHRSIVIITAGTGRVITGADLLTDRLPASCGRIHPARVPALRMVIWIHPNRFVPSCLLTFARQPSSPVLPCMAAKTRPTGPRPRKAGRPPSLPSRPTPGQAGHQLLTGHPRRPGAPIPPGKPPTAVFPSRNNNHPKQTPICS